MLRSGPRCVVQGDGQLSARRGVQREASGARAAPHQRRRPLGGVAGGLRGASREKGTRPLSRALFLLSKGGPRGPFAQATQIFLDLALAFAISPQWHESSQPGLCLP